jgi:hypothetical protein
MAMRTIMLLLSTTLLAGAGLAQETAKQPGTPESAQQPGAPDYSRPTLMRLFVIDPQTAGPALDAEIGSVRLRSRYANVLVGYLPFFAPLPGSVPTTTRQMVDPFVMTHMEIPAGPRVMRRERARELKRIERLTRSTPPDTKAAGTTVKATP